MAFWNRKPQPAAEQFASIAQDSLMEEYEPESNQGLSKDQLFSALNAAQTALMMIDRDFNITYVNQKSVDLLKMHETLFQSLWPNFRADEKSLIGYCIDGFHSNPAHQRQMLSNPSNLPYTTTIDVKDVKIELNVGAIIDGQGNYVGNTLEWADVTAAIAQQDDIARLQAAVDQAQTAMVMIDRKSTRLNSSH